MKSLLLFILALSWITPAWALRCGTSLVEEGDRRREVLEECGKPTAEYSQRVAYQLEIGDANERRRYQTIEYWVYIGDSNKFARILYFENGVLKLIRQGSYGREYDRYPGNCRRENISIEINQSKPELELRCGPADAKQVVEEYSRAVVLDNATRVLKTIVVDEWLYYRGDELWVYRFENGLLKWQGEKDPDTYLILP